jgi:hypothetical protein
MWCRGVRLDLNPIVSFKVNLGTGTSPGAPRDG